TPPYRSAFYYDPSTPVSYTLSLHDALPISLSTRICTDCGASPDTWPRRAMTRGASAPLRTRSVASPEVQRHRRPALLSAPYQPRSEEHTSELQSRENLVCRLLLEKKKERI